MTTLSDAIRKLADAAGLDEHVVSDVQIMSAIRYRMRASQHLEATDYDRWASAIQTEKAELFEDLLVRESWFFRDKAPFDALRAHETVLDLVCRLLLEKKKTHNLLHY